MAGLKQIRPVRRHSHESVSRAHFRNRAFVAIHAAVVPNLQEQGTVPEPGAAFHAFGAAAAEGLVARVSVLGILDVGAPDRRGRTQAILGACVEVIGVGLEEPGAKLAVAAHRIGMDAFDGRLLQDAMRGAVTAVNTLLRIDLPNHSLGASARCQQPCQADKAESAAGPQPALQELAPGG